MLDLNNTSIPYKENSNRKEKGCGVPKIFKQEVEEIIKTQEELNEMENFVNNL